MQPREGTDDGASMIDALRRQIEQESYEVDPGLVAAAMLAKRDEWARLRLLRSQVLVAAQSDPASTGEPQPFTGRYTA